MLPHLLPLWVLVLVNLSSQSDQAPQPTDCTSRHDIQEYCGVAFYCKCIWEPPTMLEALEGCGLNAPCSLSEDNEVHPVWFPDSEITLESLRLGLNDNDDESSNEVEVDAKSNKNDRNQFVRLFYHVDNSNNKAFAPEDLDAEGCGVPMPGNEDAHSTRVAVIADIAGVQYMPGNIAALLKSIHNRTRGRCTFKNRAPLEKPKKCKQEKLSHFLESEEAQDEKRFAIRVNLRDPGMSETVINTVRQDFAIKYSSSKDHCFKTADDHEIVCMI